MIEKSRELIHMLGYLNESQWKDALSNDYLDKKELKLIIKWVEEYYRMELNLEVEE